MVLDIGYVNYISQQCAKVPLSLLFLLSSCNCHPNWGEIIFHYSLDPHFLIISGVDFSMHLLASSMPSFKKWWASELAQQVNALATKADGLSSSHRTLQVEGENLRLQVVRWRPCMHSCTFAHTCMHLHSQQINCVKRIVFYNFHAVIITL